MGSENDELRALRRNIEHMQRRLDRHVQFRRDAAKHIPNLIGMYPWTQKYKDALEWWSQCSTEIALSAAKAHEGDEESDAN